MSERTPLGPIIDSLGITAGLDEHDMITDILIVAKVVNADSDLTAVGIFHNRLDWVTQLGLITAADHVIRGGDLQPVDDD